MRLKKLTRHALSVFLLSNIVVSRKSRLSRETESSQPYDPSNNSPECSNSLMKTPNKYAYKIINSIHQNQASRHKKLKFKVKSSSTAYVLFCQNSNTISSIQSWQENNTPVHVAATKDNCFEISISKSSLIIYPQGNLMSSGQKIQEGNILLSESEFFEYEINWNFDEKNYLTISSIAGKINWEIESFKGSTFGFLGYSTCKRNFQFDS